MKILALSNLYPPNAVGGYEILCFEVMCSLAAKGHTVVVLTSSYGDKQADYANQQVLRSLTLLATNGNIYQPFTPSAEDRDAINKHNVELLNQVLAEQDPDLVFVWNLHFYDVSLLTALERSGRRLVYLLTDNWLIAFYNGNFIAQYFSHEVYGRPPGLTALLRRIKRTFAGALTTIPPLRGSAIFASHFMQQLYHDAGFRFTESTIIHHGVTAPLAAPMPFADRSRLLYEGKLRLLFAGRVVEIKGCHTIIEALPQIIKGLPMLQVELSIVGDDRDQPYLAQLRNRIQELGLTSAVTFAPAVPETDLFQLFQTHDLYLFPSLYEPFSLTLIHALQAGIPTVASTVGGNPEIITNGITGMLFGKGLASQLAAQTIRLAQDHPLRTRVATQARQYASTFTFSRMIGQVETHLETIRQKAAQ